VIDPWFLNFTAFHPTLIYGYLTGYITQQTVYSISE